MLFFQAEDGIRDLVRSRGLGDVYKRQIVNQAAWADVNGDGKKELTISGEWMPVEIFSYQAVSYTHLTLPTSDLV